MGPHVLETTTGPDTLAAVHRTLEEVWAEHPVPDAVRMRVDLAAGEIAANIVEHAGGGAPVRLRLEVLVRDGRLEAVFADDGLPADLDPAEAVMPDAWAESGRGLALARQVLDELRYAREGASNRWTLVHRLA